MNGWKTSGDSYFIPETEKIQTMSHLSIRIDIFAMQRQKDINKGITDKTFIIEDSYLWGTKT